MVRAVRHQEILFSVAGQSFHHDPPEMFRPSGTPTVQVFRGEVSDDNSAEAATTGSCSVDPVNTTFSASAGAQTLTVASGTGIVRGRRYLVADADGGEREWVEVMGIKDEEVTLRRPLVNSFASSSTFQGTRISIGVDSIWVADSGNLTDVLAGSWRTDEIGDPQAYAGQSGYRLRWSYTVNGSATVGVSFADLVRYSAKNLVAAPDVDARFPGWIDMLGPDYRYDQGAAIVAEAFHAVRMDLLGDAQVARRIRNTEVLRELTIYRANLIVIENQVLRFGGNPVALEVARAGYEERFNKLAREPKFPVDQSGTGASEPAVRLPAFRR